MSYEVIIIGDNIDTQEYNNVVNENNITLISFNSKSSALDACKKFKKNNAFAILYSDFKNLIENKIDEYEPLEEINETDLMCNQFRYSEEFFVLNNGNFNNFQIYNEDIKLDAKNLMFGKVLFSNTGCFLANFFETKLCLFCSNLTRKYNDFDFEENIIKVNFSKNDKFFNVYTESKTFVIETSTGKIFKLPKIAKLTFDKNEEKIYNLDDFNIYDLNFVVIDQHKYKKISNYNLQTLYFLDGNVQKIIYENGQVKNQKLQANISNINFLFSENLGFSYITKKIKENYFYFIEIYCKNNLFLINLTYELKDLKVSDDYILIFDILNKITFFKRKNTGFVKVKEISKDDMCILSQSKNISCIYDSATENIEFYDNCELRTVYSQRECSKLQWSYSGLYLASVSFSIGLIQIFNNNGKLIYKKLFNVLENFMWRPFIKLDANFKKKSADYNLEEYVKNLNIPTISTYNIDVLIAEWKSFLIKKRQLII